MTCPNFFFHDAHCATMPLTGSSILFASLFCIGFQPLWLICHFSLTPTQDQPFETIVGRSLTFVGRRKNCSEAAEVSQCGIMTNGCLIQNIQGDTFSAVVHLVGSSSSSHNQPPDNWYHLLLTLPALHNCTLWRNGGKYWAQADLSCSTRRLTFIFWPVTCNCDDHWISNPFSRAQ